MGSHSAIVLLASRAGVILRGASKSHGSRYAVKLAGAIAHGN